MSTSNILKVVSHFLATPSTNPIFPPPLATRDITTNARDSKSSRTSAIAPEATRRTYASVHRPQHNHTGT